MMLYSQKLQMSQDQEPAQVHLSPLKRKQRSQPSRSPKAMTPIKIKFLPASSQRRKRPNPRQRRPTSRRPPTSQQQRRPSTMRSTKMSQQDQNQHQTKRMPKNPKRTSLQPKLQMMQSQPMTATELRPSNNSETQ